MNVLALAAVAGAAVPLVHGPFDPSILSPAPWWWDSWPFLVGAFLATVAVALVLTVLAVSPLGNRSWTRPTHHDNPFRFGNPLLFFHFAGWFLVAGGSGMVLGFLVGRGWQLLYGLLVVTVGVGCLLAVHLAMWLRRHRMAPRQEGGRTSFGAWPSLAAVFVILVLTGTFLHSALQDSLDSTWVTSCANHFIQHRSSLEYCAGEHPDLILLSTADTRAALSHIYRSANEVGHSDEWLGSYASACPEASHRDGSIGYVYVGDGLRLGDVAERGILILFCPAESHRRSQEHCHGWALPDGGICLKDNAAMMEVLKKAIARGESGDVAYSQRAMKVLREELRKRQQ